MYAECLTRIEAWFTSRGWTPFPFQREVWDAYLRGESGLVHAATGTGKTLAAWMGPLVEWMNEQAPRHTDADDEDTPQPRARKRPRRDSAPKLRVLWITPLRALAADTAEALGAPVRSLGLPWTIETRTGDTSAALRARQRRKLPTALITTPESVSLLLSRDDAPEMFEELQLVVVDEWHELLGTKRGVQTELALSRLRALRPGLRTWGLSATIGNLDEAAEALLGVTPRTPARIVRGVESKAVIVDSLIPPVVERFPWAGHLGTQMLPQVIAAIDEGESAIVF